MIPIINIVAKGRCQNQTPRTTTTRCHMGQEYWIIFHQYKQQRLILFSLRQQCHQSPRKITYWCPTKFYGNVNQCQKSINVLTLRSTLQAALFTFSTSDDYVYGISHVRTTVCLNSSTRTIPIKKPVWWISATKPMNIARSACCVMMPWILHKYSIRYGIPTSRTTCP